MAIYKAFSPNAEIIGEGILGYISGMGAFESTAREFLKEHGIDDPVPGKWYSHQAFLDTLEAIEIKVVPATLWQIGQKIADIAPFPPDVDTVEKALVSVGQSYEMNHRGDDAGDVQFIGTGDRTAKMVCRTPYPSELEMGIVEGFAAKFGGRMVKVVLDESQPTREQGADSCTYLVSWT
jgi:hypothetical protein